MKNKWVQHVLSYSRKHRVSFKDALSLAKNTYQTQLGSGAGGAEKYVLIIGAIPSEPHIVDFYFKLKKEGSWKIICVSDDPVDVDVDVDLDIVHYSVDFNVYDNW